MGNESVRSLVHLAATIVRNFALERIVSDSIDLEVAKVLELILRGEKEKGVRLGLVPLSSPVDLAVIDCLRQAREEYRDLSDDNIRELIEQLKSGVVPIAQQIKLVGFFSTVAAIAARKIPISPICGTGSD